MGVLAIGVSQALFIAKGFCRGRRAYSTGAHKRFPQNYTFSIRGAPSAPTAAGYRSHLGEPFSSVRQGYIDSDAWEIVCATAAMDRGRMREAGRKKVRTRTQGAHTSRVETPHDDPLPKSTGFRV
jgi:hypothetical protein